MDEEGHRDMCAEVGPWGGPELDLRGGVHTQASGAKYRRFFGENDFARPIFVVSPLGGVVPRWAGWVPFQMGDWVDPPPPGP